MMPSTSLRVQFDARQSTSLEAQQVLDVGSRIDRFMRRNTINAATQREWANLRVDLDSVGACL